MEKNEITLILTGLLPGAVLVSVVLTAVTSWIFLQLYRRRVLQLMVQLQDTAPEPSERKAKTDNQSNGEVPSLLIEEEQLDMPPAMDSSQEERGRASTSLRTSGIIYALGGLIFALVFAAVWMISKGGGFFFGRFLFLVACYLFPAVLAVNMATATNKREVLSIVGAYGVVMLTVIWFTLSRNPDLPLIQPLQFWLIANTPGTVLLFIFHHSRIRSVSPMMLGFMTAGMAGAFLLVEMVSLNQNSLQFLVKIGGIVGITGRPLLLLIELTGFIALGFFGWRFLLWLGKRYRAKRLSDQSITIDALFLFFAIVNSFILVFDGWQWILTGPLAFAAYKTTTIAGFRMMARSSEGSAGAPMLLLLRVFALGRRSERFFDAFSKKWRYHGSIILISGPDLMTKTVEPHEILDFVSGRLAQQFVKNTDDLERQIAALDRRPDPDGRFRVNEFFCHADTWQMTMRRLANECKAILMDLRGFTQENQGCLYELEQLLLYVDLGRVVFLVDSTTDRVFLEETLHLLWLRVDRTSPNRASSSPTVRLFPVMGQQRQAMNRLQTMLLEAQTAA